MLIIKRSKLLSLVFSMGLLLGLTITGCTDSDRDVDPSRIPSESSNVYVDVSGVKIGYTKVVLKGEDEEENIELEFDENGISTTPVATVTGDETAKFNLSFIQEQTDISDLAKYIEESEHEIVEREIATYDVSEDGVAVESEGGKATVAIEEVSIANPNCFTIDLSGITASKGYGLVDKELATYAYVTVIAGDLDINIAVKLNQRGEGFAPISVDGIDVDKCSYMFYLASSDRYGYGPIATLNPLSVVDTNISFEDGTAFTYLSDDDIATCVRFPQ